jgi:hypothetical protein
LGRRLQEGRHWDEGGLADSDGTFGGHCKIPPLRVAVSLMRAENEIKARLTILAGIL